jgi:cell division protein FtsN
MRSNNFFTYLLYALLGLLVLAAGYLALDKSKKDAQIAEELKKDYEQLNQTIKENGYVDNTQTNSSTYVGESDKTKPTADKNGIEDGATTKTSKPTASATKSTTASATKPIAPTAKPAPPTQLVAKGGAVPKQKAVPTNSGRYHLVVGAFSQVENARIEMERFVKMGYRDAEVVKYKTDLWRVVAKRCKSRAEAEKYEGDLARNGIDAMVVDSYKK